MYPYHVPVPTNRVLEGPRHSTANGRGCRPASKASNAGREALGVLWESLTDPTKEAEEPTPAVPQPRAGTARQPPARGRALAENAAGTPLPRLLALRWRQRCGEVQARVFDSFSQACIPLAARAFAAWRSFGGLLQAAAPILCRARGCGAAERQRGWRIPARAGRQGGRLGAFQGPLVSHTRPGVFPGPFHLTRLGPWPGCAPRPGTSTASSTVRKSRLKSLSTPGGGALTMTTRP